jgi:sulfiredoxin
MVDPFWGLLGILRPMHPAIQVPRCGRSFDAVLRHSWSQPARPAAARAGGRSIPDQCAAEWEGAGAMMKREKFEIASIYVPVKRRSTLNPDVVQQIARSMLESGQETPILVRRDGDRLVLVHGLHRLEACKALGEATIFGYLVQAQKH